MILNCKGENLKLVGLGWIIFGLVISVISVLSGLIKYGIDKSYYMPFTFVCVGCCGMLLGHVFNSLHDK